MFNKLDMNKIRLYIVKYCLMVLKMQCNYFLANSYEKFFDAVTVVYWHYMLDNYRLFKLNIVTCSLSFEYILFREQVLN